MLVDVHSSLEMTGKEAEQVLDQIGITCNKNTIPFETQSPFITSGIRLGTPALTTRGLQEDDFREIASIIADVLHAPADADVAASARQRVAALCRAYPLYE